MTDRLVGRVPSPFVFRLSSSSPASTPLDARALAATLAWLRPCAAIGQALAIAAAIIGLHVALPLVPLVTGIAVLTLATPIAFWRLRRAWPLGEAEAVCHVAFDLLLLGWALYFTGGASNPFITLLMLPVALTAMALSPAGTAAVVMLATALYAVLIFHNVPLPDMSMHSGSGFRLHLTGMAINFLIAVMLLAVFMGRMTASLRMQREATRRLHERMLRDEGILAIATQAAEAAHELNTPLSTLRTLLPELERGREEDAALRSDVRLMVGEVERCRAILRCMVEYGRRQLSGVEQTVTLGEYVRGNVERFRLLCPGAEVNAHVAASQSGHPVAVQPGLAHALLNLMQNAFDASAQNGSRLVTLDADMRDGRVEFVIGDRGDGIPDDRLEGMSVASSKPDGLGVGLALARSTIERMRGELCARHDTGGTRVLVRVPLANGAGR
jgi:two-component system, sensor histidine kinase RegB